jgi:phospholipid/cholesterol/gamma-HCH transport system substrate-binding protein
METRANYVIVGIFTVVAIIAAFGFVYWIARFGETGETAALRFRIPGSASGLGRGSSVLFNGVKVGSVERVYIDPKNPTVAIADTQVDAKTPVTQSTVADVGIAGLTGQANIELRGGNPAEPNLLAQAAERNSIAEIQANPSAVTNLLEKAQDIFARTDKVLDGLQGFVQDSRGPLTQTIRNTEKFSQALADNSDKVDDFLASAGDLATTLRGVSGKLGSTLDSAKGLIDAVNHDKVAKVVDNIQTFTGRLDHASRNLDQIMANVDEASKSLKTLSDGANGTLRKVDGILDSVDPAEVRSALANINEASKSANAAMADISKVTTRVGEHADDIDHIMAEGRDVMDKLNDASTRVNGILVKVDNMLGSGDTNGLIQQAKDTLKSFRQMADTINAKLGPITAGIARFSGQGLNNVDQLVSEARRAINRIEEAFTGLAQNPQRILTGGEGSVRQYDGRLRR